MKALSVQLKAVTSTETATTLATQARVAGIDTLLYNVSAVYTPGSFDRLGALITAAHAADLRVLAWVCPGADPYFTSRWPVSGGGFTDYGNPAARAAMAAGVAALMASYDLDGAIADYIRAPKIDTTPYTPDDVTAAVYGMEEAVGPDHWFVVTVKAYAAGSAPDWERWSQPWPTWMLKWIAEGKTAHRRVVPMVYSPTRYGDFAPHVQAWLDTGVPLNVIMPKMSVINTQIAGENTPKTAAVWAAEFALWAETGMFNLAAWDQRILDLPEHLAAFSAFALTPETPVVDLETELQALGNYAAEVADTANNLGQVAADLGQVTVDLGQAAESILQQINVIRDKLT